MDARSEQPRPRPWPRQSSSGSRQLLRLGREWHLFNPAASALVAASAFVPAVSWWAVAWGRPVLVASAVAGLIILRRLRRFHIAVPFVVSYFRMSFLKVLGTGAVLALFGAGCAAAQPASPTTATEPPPVNAPAAFAPTAPPAPAPANAPSEKVIEITAAGFVPPELTIKSGTAVRFVNRDVMEHWPASGVHPTHQLCPGFDPLRPLAQDEAYRYVFSAPKTCPFHDHQNPTLRGKITVLQ